MINTMTRCVTRCVMPFWVQHTTGAPQKGVQRWAKSLVWDALSRSRLIGVMLCLNGDVVVTINIKKAVQPLKAHPELERFA